ncbi:MAG TPA: hypothetical protein DCW90_07150 [Lachnospiraceae bacterium]|nr:hypothetical protein [Lachnospiraceae bacterium]
MYENKNHFQVCFNIMKLRYSDFDRMVDNLNMLSMGDNINVFINMETVLRNLCTVRDIDQKMIGSKNVGTGIIADTLNLAAHYKRFFVDNGLHTRVFIYMTDLQSDAMKEEKWNEDYRSYYFLKYNRNPKYESLREELEKTVYAQLRSITQFIPDVYFITAKNFDGTMIPYIIGESDPSYKNFIISSDCVETQYTLFPNYVHFYMKRGYSANIVNYTMQAYLENIFKLKASDGQYANLFCNRSFYLCLFGGIGEKYRCIDKISDLTPLRVVKYLISGLENHLLTFTTESVELLLQVFPKEIRNELENDIRQIDIKFKNNELTEEDRFQIQSQIINRFDNNSLTKLSQTMFYDNPLMLEELTKQVMNRESLL